ncbi:asporin [Aplysia californica]|uniref:Asporin n=1 Tax=Aplysia californica TaxID=6500 RepID=A0ABM1AFF4_APLCA|nr:asporin [Aplysia californica]
MLSGEVSHSLRQLTLTSLAISSLTTSALPDLHNLTDLALPRNLLTEVPSFLVTWSLTSLNLEGNRISRLTTGHLPRTLQHLYLANNRIQVIDPDTFHQLPGLIDLDLSKNPQLTPGQDTFRSLTRGFLNLAHTRLDSLDFVRESWVSTVSLEVSGAGLPCDCKLRYFLLNRTADISGTCLDYVGEQVRVPGREFWEYVRGVDCDCLREAGESCAQPVLVSHSGARGTRPVSSLLAFSLSLMSLATLP